MSFPMVALGEVLTERKEVPSTYELANRKFRIISKVGFNDGKIQLRDDYETKTGMILIRPGDIVVSGINAAKGAIALYDSGNAEPIAATIHYSSYIPKLDNVDTKFIWWLLRSNTFREILYEYLHEGIKSELKSKRLLPIPVPLPPLSEQRRIVAHTEELASKIEEARKLRLEAEEEAMALVSSLHSKLANGRTVKLGEVLKLDEIREGIIFGKKYPQVGVKGFGQGLFKKNSLDITETTYKGFNRLYNGAVVLSQVKGWEGAIAVCDSSLAGMFVSPEYRTFRCIDGKAIPDYLRILFANPWFWTRLRFLTRGVGARRERIRPEQFLDLEISMPTSNQQEHALFVFDKLDLIRHLQAETGAELDALLPAVLDGAFKGEL